MSAQVTETVHCPRCGVPNQRRQTVAEVIPGIFVTPSEVVWCQACRYEIQPDAPGGETP